jgi:general secretion pathway protein L
MAEAGMNPSTVAANTSDGFNVASGAQFLAWWRQHLWECVPNALRQRASRAARPAMVSIADGLAWPARSELQQSVALSGSPLLNGDRSSPKSLALVVGERNGFRRDVALPLTVEPRLAQVLAYELDRLTPLKPGDLYFDFRVKRRDNANGLCIVEVVAAPKARVNPMIAEIESRGGKVDRLLLAASDADGGVDLMRASRKVGETVIKNARLTPLLLIVCAALAASMVAYPIFKKRQHVIALQPTESSARAEAETATVIQRQLEKQVSDYNFLLKRKHSLPIVVQVLEDVGKRLPDDTWAQSFEIKPQPNTKTREVIVQGETGSGAKLLQLVQESPLLKDPTLKAAMTRVAPTAERFHFAGELIAAGPPGGLSLSDVSTPMSLPMSVAPNAAAGSPASAAPTPNSPLKAAINADAAAKTAGPLAGTLPAQIPAVPMPSTVAAPGAPVAPPNPPPGGVEPKKAMPITGVPNGQSPYQPTQLPTMPSAAEKKQ